MNIYRVRLIYSNFGVNRLFKNLGPFPVKYGNNIHEFFEKYPRRISLYTF